MKLLTPCIAIGKRPIEKFYRAKLNYSLVKYDIKIWQNFSLTPCIIYYKHPVWYHSLQRNIQRLGMFLYLLISQATILIIVGLMLINDLQFFKNSFLSETPAFYRLSPSSPIHQLFLFYSLTWLCTWKTIRHLYNPKFLRRYSHNNTECEENSGTWHVSHRV